MPWYSYVSTRIFHNYLYYSFYYSSLFYRVFLMSEWFHIVPRIRDKNLLSAEGKRGKERKRGRERKKKEEEESVSMKAVDRAKASRSFFDRNKNRRCLIFVCVKEGISCDVKGGQWQKASPRMGVGLVWESSQTAWSLISILPSVTRSFLINFLIVTGLRVPRSSF